MTTANFTVTGMTCEHCVMSVTEEVSAVPGVDSVDVDLPSGRVTVTSAAPIGTAEIETAVEEAGYQLA